ncbi:FAD:protein FMN transferase [bacterium]|nr:FAD:protein FMN transferase [bacterium]
MAVKDLLTDWKVGIRLISGLVFLIIILGSCTKDKVEPVEIVGSALGTVFSIKLVSIPADVNVSSLQFKIEELLTQIDSFMSVFYPTSEISRFNDTKSTDWFNLSPEVSRVIAESLQISEETGGAFDFTIGNQIELWGFGRSAATGKIPDESKIQTALQTSGYQKFLISKDRSSIRKNDPGLSINLSASAKGYAVDRVAQLLEENKIFSYLVEIGGEIKTKGKKNGAKPWLVAIERPDVNKRSIQKILKLGNDSMATSGDYRNFFEIENQRFSHTIDPKTGWPVNNEIASVSVIHPSCLKADALATALIVMGFERGFQFAQKHNYRVFWILREQGELVEKYSPEFKPFLD